MKMTRRTWLLAAFGAALFFQMSVLAGEYLMAMYPRWTGEEVRLRVRPVDPRSLFRGNYARLNYDISVLPASLAERAFGPADVVYVQLEKDPRGDWEARRILAEPGEQGLYLRGRIQGNGFPLGGRGVNRDDYRIRYGIEAWFAPKEKALALEEELRDGGMAVIRVADSGRAALMGVEP